MFNKKKKKKREEQFIDDEIVVSMGDVAKAIEKKEEVKIVEVEDDEIEVEQIDIEQIKIEEIEDMIEDDPADQDNLEQELEEVTELDETNDSKEATVEDATSKKDLAEYFEEGRKKNKKIKVKKEKIKKKSKRQLKKAREFADIKDRRIFRYENKKYNKVEDFIMYLNNHYLDIEKIALEVLDDENFYGWISKRSGVFDESLKKFKELKEKIEK